MELSTLPLVCVIWDDAHGRTAGEYTQVEILRDLHHPAAIYTFGLLVADDETGVTVAQEITNPDEDGDSTYRGLGFVPRGMVKEVINLGIPKRPRARTSSKRKSANSLRASDSDLPPDQSA
jgi:hypothetical protein